MAKKDRHLTTTELLEYYDTLFGEESPIKIAPLLLDGMEEEEKEGPEFNYLQKPDKGHA